MKVKGKSFSLPNVGPGPEPGVQAFSPRVTISHPPGSRLPLHSAKPAVTFPAAEHHRLSAGTKLYCLVTEAHRCEQLAEGCYAAFAFSKICTHDPLYLRGAAKNFFVENTQYIFHRDSSMNPHPFNTTGSGFPLPQKFLVGFVIKTHRSM